MISEARWAPVAHTCNPNYSRGSGFEASLRQIVHETLCGKKNPTQNRACEIAQVVERLLSELKTPGSNPSTNNNNKMI
jgi:hypothetical protein